MRIPPFPPAKLKTLIHNVRRGFFLKKAHPSGALEFTEFFLLGPLKSWPTAVLHLLTAFESFPLLNR